MFERYTEEARRAVFFARYEASVRGTKKIGLCELLLGICHDAHTRANRLTNVHNSAEEFRGRITLKFPPGNPVPKDKDMELDNPGKMALAYAAEEAEKLKEWIDSTHLLLGILRQKGLASDLLTSSGISASDLRDRITTDPVPRPVTPDPIPASPYYGSSRRLNILAALLVISALIAAAVIIVRSVAH